MALTLKTLLRRFTFWAGGIALAALLGLSLLAGRGASRTLERLSDQCGTVVAARAAALVANYVRERHVEADQLAANPYLIRAAIDAAQTVVARRLDQVPPADLERMFAGTRRLEGDPELLRYLRSYPGRSEFTDLTLTERHGLVVIASGFPERFRPADRSSSCQFRHPGAASRRTKRPTGCCSASPRAWHTPRPGACSDTCGLGCPDCWSCSARSSGAACAGSIAASRVRCRR